MCVTLSFVGAAWAVPASKTITASMSMEAIFPFCSLLEEILFELIVLFVVLFFFSIVRLSEIGKVLERLSGV